MRSGAAWRIGAQHLQVGVGCELAFKPLLGIDTNHGSVFPNDNRLSERFFDPYFHLVRREERRPVLGEHGPCFNTPETTSIFSPDHERSTKEPDRDILDERCRSVFRQMDETKERKAQSLPASRRVCVNWRSIGEIRTADHYAPRAGCALGAKVLRDLPVPAVR